MGKTIKESIIPVYAERLLGKGGGEIPEEYGKTEFGKRDEDEQSDIFFKIHDLVAEQRDIVRSVSALEKEGEDKPKFVIKRLRGGRRVRMPVETGGVEGEKYEQTAVRDAKKRQKEIKAELKAFGNIPGVKEAYQKKLYTAYFLMKTAREIETYKDRAAEIEADQAEIQAQSIKSESGGPVGAIDQQIDLLEQEKQKLQAKIDNSLEYIGGHNLDRYARIHDYVDAYSENQIVEFPSAGETVQAGLEHMENRQPFLLAGHLGSGKTEMAKHMARLFMIEKGAGYDTVKDQDPDKIYDQLQPEIFSGGEEASVYDLVGKLKLVGKETDDPKALAKNVEKLDAVFQKNWDTKIPKKEIAAILLGKSEVTETIFNYGPMGRALKRGVPIIIDEINMIPPEVISRINDVLLRGVGDRIRLQENGEEELEIKPGFAILATCNLGSQYAGIKDVNAAFKSRWVSKEVGYPTIDELYDLTLAALVRKDRVRMPPNFPPEAFDQLIDLTMAVHEIQNIFSGKTEGARYMALATGAAAEKTGLEKSVVSTRDLMRKIIGPWKKSRFKKSLSEIIAKNILASEVWSKDDQKFMTEIFLRRGFLEGMEEEDLQKMGIESVSQKEIDALNTNMATYRTENKDFENLVTSAKGSVSLMREDLLIGTKKQKKK